MSTKSICVGDMIKMTFHGGHWTGWVLEIEHSLGEGGRVATIWRPELVGIKKAIQTWPLDSQYQIEVINEK